MNAPEPIAFIRQHLIDPEVCIRCNTCEETCPIDAITHDSRNYVVKADVCNGCGACISPCPTGSIDHWHIVPKASAYSIEEQLTWDELPPKQDIDPSLLDQAASDNAAEAAVEEVQVNASSSATSPVPPWSAAHPYINLYTLKNPITATIAGNYRLTDPSVESDIHHIVLDFGTQVFPILEGQSIGIIPPGVDASGKPHYMRMYSVASPRSGEREGYNNLSLTVKRVVTDHEGKPTAGVASNYLCDLQKGDPVQVTGPFGTNYLMPNHAGSNILMICTGTGSAPMRAMTEHRRRLESNGKKIGKLMLFFGARNSQELPYFGPLLKLPDHFIDKHFAFSRVEGQPKTYVQDKIREAGKQVVDLLRGDTYIYICGLKGMETGVMDALRSVCAAEGLDWNELSAKMVKEGRFHVETY
ncbi:benzoyl-CoA 2,3-epoxidase subunit BoxA [Noviherbaspirillum aerium]|uniref:benzoyl-CoA 2,3-epoxidase subunit BoxA n=1 Tax=Noviherbaspirillum aerium TaxID=2588497 RepID=UPI00124EA5E4|nr:benzoyl-CoA 2,3-epoxidase subunit BoxA [Noviherbaspirillum aerium]